MKQFKQKILYALYLTSGMIISLYFIWIRLLKVRLPHEITFNWSLGGFILNLFLFSIFAYLLIKKIYTQESQKKIVLLLKEKIIIPLSNLLLLWYQNSLQKVLDFFLADLPLPNYQDKIQEIFMPFFYKFAEKLNNINTKAKFFFVILSLIYIPRLIVVLSFSYDIIIIQKISFFYNTLWILLLPFLWNISYAIIKHIYLQYMEIIRATYILSFIPIKAGEKSGFTVKMTRSKESPGLPEEVENNIKDFYLKACVPIRIHFIELYDQQVIQQKYKSIKGLSIIIIGLYVLCFGYLALKIGLNYFF